MIKQVGAGVYGPNPLESIGAFSAAKAIGQLQIWRFVSFQFLHGDTGHLFMNMLAIFFFGPVIENYLGSRRFLRFYLFCGLAGPVAYLILWASRLVVGTADAQMVGASAGVFGILVAAALIAPNAKVLLFFVLPIPLRVLAWILVGIAAYVVVAEGHVAGSNAGGQAAHLGGAAIGFWLIKRPGLLSWPGRGRLRRTAPSGSSRPPRRQVRIEQNERDVDRILTKVKEGGLHSLTRHEKRTLHRATHRQRQGG